MAVTYCDGNRSEFQQATAYNATTNYKKNNIVYVTSNGTTSYYKCIKNCTGIVCTNTEYWSPISSEQKEYFIDNLVEMFELSSTDATNVQRWKVLKAKANRTTEEETEFQTLTTTLSQKIVTSEDWNKLCDCMINLEKMYVNKGLDEINETIEEYVEEYAQTDINAKLGTLINNLLLTNATRIIISTTQPTVVNGALWIKPRTNS